MSRASTEEHVVPRRRSRLRFALRSSFGSLLAAAACSNLLGIENESTEVQCITNKDCPANFACEANRCVCERNCGVAGQGGMAGMAGHGGSGGAAGVEEAGAAGIEGGTGGTETGGEGGNPGDSGAGGIGGQPGNEQGGAGAGGEKGECDPKVPSCLVCDDGGNYLPGKTHCPIACGVDARCETPNSCNLETMPCGENETCCLSLPIPGEEFTLSCDNTCHTSCPNQQNSAHPSSFALDKFEVTVRRFRNFVAQFGAAKPVEKSGKILHNAQDSGWDATWNEDFLSDGEVDLRNALDHDDCAGVRMWTSSEDEHEDRPMNCVTWYEAQAFCIWDGGRLPTEAEWNYAAAGGKEERVYPWGDEITPTDAVYWSAPEKRTEPEPVGSHSSPGKWGHLDLSGNVAEWVLDGFQNCFDAAGCNDCGTTRGFSHKVTRGGAFSHSDLYVKVQRRDEVDGASRDATIGFRCARDF